MDVNKEFDNFRSSMKNFNINIASEFLNSASFNIKYAGEIIDVLGKGLTEENFKSRPDYFNFCEKQLLKMANNEEYQEVIFDFLDIIEMDDCKLSSSVLVAVTVLENTESPNRTSLEYLLISTFNNLNEMNVANLQEILLNIVQLLIKLKKHFQLEQSILHYFARIAFLVLRANIDPIEYLNLLSNIIYDPFYLLEYEFDEKEEELYMASFFYLYFKTGIQWGPKIYNQFYVLEKCCNLAMSVFDNNNFGKSFAKLILTKFKNNEIPLHSLNKYHESFLLEAAHSSVYNEHLNVRKESIESLMIFLDKLSIDAQYVVLKSAFSKPLESCIKDQLIIKLKDLIILKLKSNQVLGYFQGTRLLELIQLCCNIPDTPGCNIENIKEHILSAISLIYFLSINNNEKLNLGEEFSNKTKQFVNKIQNTIDNAREQHNFEQKVLDDKIVIESKIEVNNLDYSKLSKDEKRNILSRIYTTITLVQLNLDMLKSIIID
uniref:Glomulin n=1 Tax=Schizaphis graminum TaxID=13262 RepID=A0A2S2P8K6_SCHGA